MPFDLPLTRKLRVQGWKVKIREKERVEPPHVTVMNKFVFLGSQKGLFKEPLPPGIAVCHDRSEVEAAVTDPPRHATWVSFTRHFTDILLLEVVHARSDLRGSHLITLTPPRKESIPALLGLFHPVF